MRRGPRLTRRTGSSREHAGCRTTCDNSTRNSTRDRLPVAALVLALPLLTLPATLPLTPRLVAARGRLPSRTETRDHPLPPCAAVSPPALALALALPLRDPTTPDEAGRPRVRSRAQPAPGVAAGATRGPSAEAGAHRGGGPEGTVPVGAGAGAGVRDEGVLGRLGRGMPLKEMRGFRSRVGLVVRERTLYVLEM